MSDLISQLFDKFLGAECSAQVFERELLAVCSPSPERAWEALALLDRYYRQRKLSDALCRALRLQIGAHAMRLEGHAVEPHDADPDPLFAATMAAAGMHLQHPAAMTPPRPEPTATSQAPAAGPSAAAPKTPPTVAQTDATSLGTDGVEMLLTTPTLPIAREAERERARAPTAGERTPDLKSTKATGKANPARWRRGFQTSPALGLIAVVLGVAASTQVQDPPELLEPITPDVSTVAAPVSDSDHDPTVVSLSADRYLVQPHQRTVEFTVERTGSGDASFVWWTQPSSARSSEDYVGTRARVVDIPDGKKSMTLQVPILANPQRRHIDMFYVVIGNAEGGAELGAIRRAAVFIFPSGQN